MTDPEHGIARFHADDVRAAQSLLQDAIRTAGAQWLPIDAIADALALELVEAWRRCRSTEALPEHISNLAGLVAQGRSRRLVN
jgi:hypothetical protein